MVRQILIERDDDLLDVLAEAEAPPAVVRKVKKHLADDRESRALTAHETASRLSLTISARSMLHHLRSHRLEELKRDAEALLEQRKKLDLEAEDVDRALSITPKMRGSARSSSGSHGHSAYRARTTRRSNSTAS